MVLLYGTQFITTHFLVEVVQQIIKGFHFVEKEKKKQLDGIIWIRNGLAQNLYEGRVKSNLKIICMTPHFSFLVNATFLKKTFSDLLNYIKTSIN